VSINELPRTQPVQQPLLRAASSSPSGLTAAPAAPVTIAPMPATLVPQEQMASLVPSSKSSLNTPPTRTLSGEHRVSPPSRLTSAREVTLDEDQYDIPTFLRRQGQTEMP
jgi:hypothetical protein